MRLINGRFQMFVAHRYASHKWPIFLTFMILKHFYFISDIFYEDFPDPALMKNKEEGHGRPCFLAIQDDDGFYWMIPISSKVEKFKAIYKHKTQNGKRCDTIYFANVLGNEKAFLIQNMFPISEKYISGEYCQHSTGNPVMISEIEAKDILERFKRVLALVKQGNTKLVFPNILEIARTLKNK